MENSPDLQDLVDEQVPSKHVLRLYTLGRDHILRVCTMQFVMVGIRCSKPVEHSTACDSAGTDFREGAVVPFECICLLLSS